MARPRPSGRARARTLHWMRNSSDEHVDLGSPPDDRRSWRGEPPTNGFPTPAGRPSSDEFRIGCVTPWRDVQLRSRRRDVQLRSPASRSGALARDPGLLGRPLPRPLQRRDLRVARRRVRAGPELDEPLDLEPGVAQQPDRARRAAGGTRPTCRRARWFGASRSTAGAASCPPGRPPRGPGSSGSPAASSSGTSASRRAGAGAPPPGSRRTGPPRARRRTR